MIGINIPIRIGQATVMPGDVVLGRDGGVMFIPPQLAEKVVQYSEITHLRDTVRTSAAAGEEIHRRPDRCAHGRAPIEADFTGWLRDNIDKLPVARAQIEEILQKRAK